MQTRLVKIGNSYGVRIPKSLIQQFKLDEGVIQILAREEDILILPAANFPPLSDWDKPFAKAKRKGFDLQAD